MHRLRATVLLTAATLALAACGKDPEPVPPEPVRTDDGAAARAAAEAEAARLRAEEEARAAREAEERARAEAARIRAAVEAPVFFRYDSFELEPDQRNVLNDKVPPLRLNQGLRLLISGHADERGSIEYNLALGMRRANSVKQYLTGFGLDGSRFEVVSYGEEQPIDPGQGETAWARNRRAEFQITAGLDASR